MKQRITLEIAVDCEADAIAAVAAGADRLELCADLAGHGYTPSEELVRAEASLSNRLGPTNVAMVRPAGGTPAAARFEYQGQDLVALHGEAEMVLAAGAGGIVLGCLRSDGTIDEALVIALVKLAGLRETVFHRAIDLTPDPVESARRLAGLGVTRVLTSGLSAEATSTDLRVPAPRASGLSASAWQAGGDPWPRRLERIADMVRAIGSHIQVLPGGGMRAENAAELVRATGCGQVHSSGRVAGRFEAPAVAGLRASIDAAR